MRRAMGHVEFRCAVVEKGARCSNKHLEPYMTMKERADITGCGFICEEHLPKYQWASRLYSNVDESASLADEILSDPKGKRTDQFRISGKGNNIEISNQQFISGKETEKKLHNWVVYSYHKEYNDWMMIRRRDFNESKKIIVPGFAKSPKQEDPFEKGFDDE